MDRYIGEVSTRIRNIHEVPLQRKAFKNGYTFTGSSDETMIWDHIWNKSRCDRSMTQALFFAENLCQKNKLRENLELLLSWQNNVKNWWHSDGLAKVLTKLLEVSENEMLPVIKEWNSSKDQWKRRQSVVALLYYSRTKKKILPFHTIIPFIDRLQEDEDYYVQKGIGWSLRELYNVYPEQTLDYLHLAYNRITGIAFAAASEKLTQETKHSLIQLRKASRTNQL